MIYDLTKETDCYNLELFIHLSSVLKKTIEVKEYIEFEDDTTTTKLDKKEFTRYIKLIRVFAAQELELIIPDMSDKEFENFLKHYENYL